MQHDVCIEVSLSALRHNLAQVKSLLPESTAVMAVVKANGYGHGYVEPAKAFLQAGASALAVTRLDEALTLRDAGVTAPILLFAPIQPENAREAVEAGVDLTVTSVTSATAISQAAERLQKGAVVHVKVDTGMGRLGVAPDEVVALFQSVRMLPRLHIGGVYTHFATAAEQDVRPAQRQFARFRRVLDELETDHLDYGLAHAANSAAIIRLPDSHCGMVRPGTILYGQYPSSHVPRLLDLKPTWQLKARVCDVRRLEPGARIGYGGEFTAKRPIRTAVVPVGFSEGFTLAPEGPIYRQGLLKYTMRRSRRALSMEVRGRKVPVIGRVAMQMTVLDVTDVPEVSPGDVVKVPAMRIPTSALIPRVYLD